MMKKAISLALLSAVLNHLSQGMEVQTSTPTIKEAHPSCIFLGCESDTLILFGPLSHLIEFSSERLTYSLPKKERYNPIIAFVSRPEIAEKLYQEKDQPHIERMIRYDFKKNDEITNIRELAYKKAYRLPSHITWEVVKTSTNEFVGILFAETLPQNYGKHVAPQGDLHDFYVSDIKKHTYINIAYAVDPQYQNQGFATEMSLGLIETFFQHTSAEVIVHCSFEGNIGSRRSADKCGFIIKGKNDQEDFRVLRKASQLSALKGQPNLIIREQLKVQDFDQLEDDVLTLITEHKIFMNILETDADKTNSEGQAQSVEKCPKNRGELYRWCAEGYQYGQNEAPDPKFLTNPDWMVSTEHYSFRLFCFGVQGAFLPLIRYVMECHNNIWDRVDLEIELKFIIDYNTFNLMTYLIKADCINIFDYLVRYKEFKTFAFGTILKNYMGNTPLHTLEKYGSKSMIECFLAKSDLLDLCLQPDNIHGERGMTPLEISQKMQRSPEIIDLFKGIV